MSAATTRSPRTRALLRIASAAVLAIAGVAVAVLAPGMFTEADGDTPAVWARGTSGATVLVLLGVVLANAVGLRDRDQMRSLALVAALGGAATLLVIVVGAFLISIDGSRAVVGVGVILAVLPLLAIALAMQTRHLDD